jgi:predicted MFS family arabinose efflux permease
MSTLASLPFFLFTLPAGALADKVDRRKLISVIYFGLAAAGMGLAALGWLQLLNPYLILACVFFIGLGFAFDAPAWTSMVPEVVSDSELPSAVTLSGLQLNIAGIIGPALGGLLISRIGANCVFAANAACFLLVVLAVRRWKQTSAPAKPAQESFLKSFKTVVRYVLRSPRFQTVLARNFLFALFISVIPALMPILGLRVLHLSPSSLGLLFTSMGTGSVIGAALIIPWLRTRFSPNALTLTANLLIVLAYLLMALVRRTEIFLLVAALVGTGWTLSASELWVAAQRAIPSWARGRLSAAVIMISQGAMALGGVIWGVAVAMIGPIYTLLGAAFLFLSSLFLASRLSINLPGKFEERVAGVLPGNIEPPPVTPTMRKRALFVA